MASFVRLSHQRYRQHNILIRTMARHPELYATVLATVIVILAKYVYSMQTKPMIIPPKSPTRFFPVNSLVVDFPFGGMEIVTNMLLDNEILFVMYYAPWCSKSKALRPELQKTARVLQGEVKFVSVNCFWSEGDCRGRLKFPYFPQLYVYHTHLNGFRYTGINAVEHMVDFVDKLRFPLIFLHGSQEVQDFIIQNQVSVLGYFDYGTLPEPPGFLQFYYASMRILEHDLANPPKFAVVNKDVAGMFDLRTPSQIGLRGAFNGTLMYPHGRNFTSTKIVHWILKNRQEPVVQWLVPSGVKSLVFSSHLPRGPVLLHFTRIDPIFQLHHSVLVLKKIALEYKHCRDEDDNIMANLVNGTLYSGVSVVKRYLETTKICEEMRHQKKKFLYSRKCCISVVIHVDALANNSHGHSTNTCEICDHLDSMIPVKRTCSLRTFSRDVISSLASSIHWCSETVGNYNINRHTSICCGTAVMRSSIQHRRKKWPGQRWRTDHFIETGRERSVKYACRKLRLHSSEKLGADWLPTEDSMVNTARSTIQGLSCRSNRTLNFVVLDSKYHRLFAARLGVNVTKLLSVPSSSVTVLVDIQKEWQYILNLPFTQSNIENLIHNHTNGLLNRHQRSELSPPVCDKLSPVCTQDLTTHTFHTVVMDINKDVLVLFYASWCGFCASLSHVYLTLARYFKSAKNIVFARKSDSAVFPDILPITLPNLIKFVLRHATNDLRIDTAMGICSESCVQKNKREVKYTILNMYKHIQRLKEKLSFISRSLKEARALEKMDSEIETRKFRIKLLESQFLFLKQLLSKTEQQVKSAKYLEELLSKSNGFLSSDKLLHFLRQHKLLTEQFQETMSKSSLRHDEL